jgi:poly(3-hydroxybutyrate) depolymerase
VAAIAYSDSCEPARAVPFIAIRGTDDESVPFDGDLTGTRVETEPFAQQLFSEPIPDQFAEFAAAMGCEPDGEHSPLSTDVLITTYTGCDNDVPLTF